MKYKGDTPSKKVARLVIWKRIKELLGSRFLTGYHIVLLSAEAGDVPTLLGLGVDPKKIIGVDHDVHATSLAHARIPQITIERGDVADVAKELSEGGFDIVSAYLDFCGSLSDDTVGTAAKVAKYLHPHGVIAIGLKMGREMGKWAQAVADERAKVATGNRTLYLRSDLLTMELLKRGRMYKRVIYPLEFYRYSSKSTGDQKSEMLICLGTISRNDELWIHPEPAARKITRRATYTAIHADERTIAQLAGILAARQEPAHLLLNIDKKSIPPFRAHHTRGTYKGTRTSVTRHKRDA